MDERLESKVGHRGANGADVVERILARQHDSVDAELLQHGRAGFVVHRHLRRAVDLEVGIESLNQANEPEILDDDGVDSPIDGLTEKHERVDQLGGFDEDVEREIDPAPAFVRDRGRPRPVPRS